MSTALVTGASAGLGRAYATALAARGHDLVLVARDAPRLEDLSAELVAAHGVEVEVLPADLADREQLQRVADRLADPARPVDLLVNNAGFGIATPFLDTPVEDEERMLDVLVRAVLVLTHAAAGPMRERGHGAVLNVASVAAFITSGTYSAAKSWVTVFSESLDGQLAGTGVSVTAVCPGFVRTEFHERAGIDQGDRTGLFWLSAERVVDSSLDALGAGRPVVVPSPQYAALVGVLRHLPRPVLRGGLARRHRPTR